MLADVPVTCLFLSACRDAIIAIMRNGPEVAVARRLVLLLLASGVHVAIP
jgi:hypothetical protein